MAHSNKEANRALKLAKKRENEVQTMEIQKKKIKENMELKNISNKFSSQEIESTAEMNMRINTIGLITMAEMKEHQEMLKKYEEVKAVKVEKNTSKQLEKLKQRRQISTLSFNIDDEEEEDEPIKAKIIKDPFVDTSFLPDRKRDEIEFQIREELKKEWIEKQNAIKAEEIEITFSYWDSSGHRRMIKMLKGDSIYQFLQKSLNEILRHEFAELKTVCADQLMYVKEDLILPLHYTFYDFIITKARGKSGPLFQFDVKDDIRLKHDATVEKEESHAGKVVLRSWYQRNKHIFPANRWEAFDPAKTYDKYTCKDKN